MGANDQTHVLTMAGIYELPIGPGKEISEPALAWLGRNLLGGWKLSLGQLLRESGTPLSYYRLPMTSSTATP